MTAFVFSAMFYSADLLPVFSPSQCSACAPYLFSAPSLYRTVQRNRFFGVTRFAPGAAEALITLNEMKFVALDSIFNAQRMV